MIRTRKRFVCTFIIFSLLLAMPVVDGKGFFEFASGDAEKVLAETAKEKKKKAEQDLEKTNAQIDNLEDQKSTVEGEISTKSAKLDEILAAQEQLSTDIAAKQVEIEDNLVALEEAKAAQEEQYAAMKKRIQFMYENSSNDNIWTAILEADGFSDMLNRIEYVTDIYSSDRTLMDNYQAAVEEVQTIGEQLNADMEEMTAMQADYEAQQVEVEAAILDLESTADNYASQIATAEAQAEAYQDIIDTQAAIIRQQEAAAANQSSGSYDGGGTGAGGVSNDVGYLKDPSYNPSPVTNVSGQSIVNEAMKYLGNPYVWGGNSLTNGCDCSGFVQLIYAKFGISTPRYSQAFKSVGQPVALCNIQPGDVVVYPGHVAIYAGNGIIVEAQSSKAGITANRSVQCHTITAIRRLV